MNRSIKICLSVLAAVAAMLTIGAIQNFMSNPVRGCQEFNTGTHFTGYRCADGNHYIVR